MEKNKPRQAGARRLILEFLLANIGRVIEGHELRDAGKGITEWARRVRELRDEFGYQIQSHKDSSDLKPGQYRLVSTQRIPAFSRNISKETRAVVLERNGYTCQMCGLAAGDPDPFVSSRTVRLTMGHIKDKSKGGTDTPNNLRAVCTNCNEGLQNAGLPKPDTIWLLSQVRRASISDQITLLEWLKQKLDR
jgi:HNH endonuclease